MKHAIHVINSLDPENGGTSVSVAALASAVDATGRYKNTIVKSDRQDTEYPFGKRATVATADFSAFQLLSNRSVHERIDDYIRQADVVHVHGLWQTHCFASCALAHRYNKPLVISAHGMLEPWALRNKSWKKWLYSLLIERRNLRSAALLRALTPAEASDYRRFGLKNRIAIIPNGTDDQGDFTPNLAYDSWPQIRDRRIILFLSRIHYKKGIDLLVRAWSRVASQFSDAYLVIAGPDSEGSRSEVERIINEEALSERVLFTGAVFSDLKASLLNAASVFVLPSHSEGFSIAVLEALSSRLPVIISKECNFHEVSNINAGWVISPNVEEIVNALTEALNSSALELKSRGQRGRDLILRKYAWSSIGLQMADAFDWVLGGPRPSTMEIWD